VTRALMGERTPLPEGQARQPERNALEVTLEQVACHWPAETFPRQV
jgi:hypothetical protein